MFSELLSTIPGKIIAVLTSLAGLTGGVAATGNLSSAPVFSLLRSEPSVPQGASTPDMAGIPLDFPVDLVTAIPVDPAAAEEIDISIAPHKPAPVIDPEAQAAAALVAEAAALAEACLAQVGDEIAAVAAALPGIVSSAHAEALAAQAQALIDAANDCARNAAAAGVDESDRAGAALQQASALIAQIQGLDLDGVTDAVAPVLDQIPDQAQQPSSFMDWISSFAGLAQGYFGESVQQHSSFYFGTRGEEQAQDGDSEGFDWETARKYWESRESSNAYGGNPDGGRGYRSRD